MPPCPICWCSKPGEINRDPAGANLQNIPGSAAFALIRQRNLLFVFHGTQLNEGGAPATELRVIQRE